MNIVDEITGIIADEISSDIDRHILRTLLRRDFHKYCINKIVNNNLDPSEIDFDRMFRIFLDKRRNNA